MKKPERMSRSIIYQSEWINLYADKVQFPDGKIVERLHMLDYPIEAVGVLVENDKEKLLLEHAYRYHTNSIEWEVPAGGIDKGESIIEAGKREVLEETGYDTADHQFIYSYNPSNGSSNQVFHIIHCKAKDTSGTFDKNEVKEVKWFSKKELRKMIQEKTMRDGYTLSAVLLFLAQI